MLGAFALLSSVSVFAKSLPPTPQPAAKAGAAFDCAAGATTCGTTYQWCDDLGPFTDDDRSDLADLMEEVFCGG